MKNYELLRKVESGEAKSTGNLDSNTFVKSDIGFFETFNFSNEKSDIKQLLYIIT